jgi:hypothetical protein
MQRRQISSDSRCALDRSTESGQAHQQKAGTRRDNARDRTGHRGDLAECAHSSLHLLAVRPFMIDESRGACRPLVTREKTSLRGFWAGLTLVGVAVLLLLEIAIRKSWAIAVDVASTHDGLAQLTFE